MSEKESIASKMGLNEKILPVLLDGIPVLLKESQVAWVFEHKQYVVEELKKQVGNKSSEPIYLNISNKMIREAPRPTDVTPVCENRDHLASTSGNTAYLGSSSGNKDPPISTNDNKSALPSNRETGTDLESDEDTSGRLDWKFQESCILIDLVKENYSKLQEYNKKQIIWNKIQEDLNKAMEGKLSIKISAEQCRERWYTLKKAYKSYLAKSKQTGNKRPRPFLYEKKMFEVLHDDPSVESPYAKGTNVLAQASKRQISHSEDDTEDESKSPQASSSTGLTTDTRPSSKKECRKRAKTNMEEMKDFFAERDEKFLSKMEELQSTTNSLLQKLIDKL